MAIRFLILTAALQMIGVAAHSQSPTTPAANFVKGRYADLTGDYAAAARFFSDALKVAPEEEAIHSVAFFPFFLAGEFEKAMNSARSVKEPGWFVDFARKVDRFAQGDIGIRFDTNEQEQTRELYLISDAWTHVARRDFAAATTVIEEIDGAVPAYRALNEALLLSMSGDFSGAALLLEVTPNRDPALAGIRSYFEAQILYQIEGREKDAVAILSSLSELDSNPLSAMAAALLSRIESSDGPAHGFIASAKEGLALYFASLALAQNVNLSSRDDLLFLRLAQLLDRNNALLRLWTAEYLRLAESYELATIEYAAIAPAHPVRPFADINTAAALFESGEKEEAIAYAERITRDRAEWTMAHSMLARLLRLEESYDQAVAAFDSAIALERAAGKLSWRTLYDRATTLERSEGIERSYDDFLEAIEVSGGNPFVLNYLGYSLADKGLRLKEAESLILQALEKEPDNGAIIDSLGWVYYRQNRFAEAVPVLERALRLEPTDPVVVDHLGDAYWAVGRERDAEFQWRRTLSLEPDEDIRLRVEKKLAVGLDRVLAEEKAEAMESTN